MRDYGSMTAHTGGTTAEERIDGFLDNIYDERDTVGRPQIIAQVDAFDLPDHVKKTALEELPEDEWGREALREWLLDRMREADAGPSPSGATFSGGRSGP